MGDCFQTRKCWTVVMAFLSASQFADRFRVAEYPVIYTEKFEVILSIRYSCSAPTFTTVTGRFGLKSDFLFNKTCLKFIPVPLPWLCWMYKIGQPWLNYFKLPKGDPLILNLFNFAGKGRADSILEHTHSWMTFFLLLHGWAIRRVKEKSLICGQHLPFLKEEQ